MERAEYFAAHAQISNFQVFQTPKMLHLRRRDIDYNKIIAKKPVFAAAPVNQNLSPNKLQ
jgi:hypothetical protein